MTRVYYNEHDPYAAQWLRNLINAGEIAPGDVDERSIEDVVPDDVRGYTQRHWFAGIGGWSLALRRAGFPDDRPIDTASCPCFPAGTLIFTDKGQQPIEHVREGDNVLTHEGRFRRVLSTGSDYKQIVRVKGQGHPGLLTTANHPILTRGTRLNNNRGSDNYGRVVLADQEWTDAADTQGKYWACAATVPEMYSIPPIDRSKNTPIHIDTVSFAHFLGYWVGDGWVTGNTVVMCGGWEDADLLRSIVIGNGLTGGVSHERTGPRIRFGSKVLAAWLTEHFGAGACNKKIPAWLHQQSEPFREAFLNGLSLADGHSEIQPRGGGHVRRYTTISKALAVGIRILMNQSGKSAGVTYHLPKRDCVIENRNVNERGFYRVTEYEKSRSFKFSGLHGWGLVRKVEHTGVMAKVYNIEVDEDNSYVAEGIVVHNCQPFSTAGKGNGFTDERHLWPAMHHIIYSLRPELVIGEQVASNDGLAWLDLVQTDMEGTGYTFRAADLCAASIGAPHIRQRLYWVGVSAGSGCTWLGNKPAHGEPMQADALARELGHANGTGWQPGVAASEAAGHGNTSVTTGDVRFVADAHGGQQRRIAVMQGHERDGEDAGWTKGLCGAAARSETGVVADAFNTEQAQSSDRQCEAEDERFAHGGSVSILGDTMRPRQQTPIDLAGSQQTGEPQSRHEPLHAVRSSPTNGFWCDADWLFCRDGKWRPVEPSTFPLAPGLPRRVGSIVPWLRGLVDLGAARRNRVGRLRGYGNAINIDVAVNFIRSIM